MAANWAADGDAMRDSVDISCVDGNAMPGTDRYAIAQL